MKNNNANNDINSIAGSLHMKENCTVNIFNNSTD